MYSGEVQTVTVLAIGINVDVFLWRSEKRALHIHGHVADVLLSQLALEAAPKAWHLFDHQSRSKPRTTLHLVGAFKAGMGLLPIKAGQKAMKVIGPVVI